MGHLQRLGSESSTPSDIAAQSAFNPKDILHKLLIAIDQSDVSMVGGSSFAPILKRKVNFPAVAQALSNLTLKQVRLVQIEYEYHENNRTLQTDLFGPGESGVESNLNENQRAHLRALLGGTKAEESATDEERAGAVGNLATAKAAEIQRLLKGKPSKANIEQVMATLRQSREANQALVEAYSRLGGLIYVDLMRTGQVARAEFLLEGNVAAADAQQVSGSQRKLEEVNAAIKAAEGSRISGDLDMFEVIENEGKLKKLKGEQKKLIDEIEATGQQAIAEAQAEGKDAGTRIGAVYGDLAGLKAAVGEKSAPVIQAIADNQPAVRIAAELRRSAEAGKLNGAQLTAALRRLRTEAEEQAKRVLPKGAPGIEAKADSIAAEYFGILRATYNDLTGGKGKSFDELVGDTGTAGDEQLNKELVAGSGRLAEVRELVLALKGKRKDLATVDRILRNKSAAQMRELEQLYSEMAPNRSLRQDLFGVAATEAGHEEIPSSMASMMPPELAGKATGTMRLNLEDYMQRPDKEGGPAEAFYIAARAEREYKYTIDNGGLTGTLNDAWGNEPRTLLDETISEIRELNKRYAALVGFVPGTGMLLKPENVESPTAYRIIEQMRLARHVIRGDRAAYEEATAKLRATFEAIASFVLQAVLSAVLTPAAMAMFRVASGTAQAAMMANRIKKFVAVVTASTAADIGTTVAVTGDYSLDQLRNALLSNLAGPLGAGGANKLLASEMLGPVAKGLVARLGPKASAELRDFAKNIASMEASALATGESLTENLTIQGMLKEHLLSRGGDIIGDATTKAAGLDTPAPVPDTSTPPLAGETTPNGGTTPSPTAEATTIPPANEPTPQPAGSEIAPGGPSAVGPARPGGGTPGGGGGPSVQPVAPMRISNPAEATQLLTANLQSNNPNMTVINDRNELMAAWRAQQQYTDPPLAWIDISSGTAVIVVDGTRVRPTPSSGSADGTGSAGGDSPTPGRGAVDAGRLQPGVGATLPPAGGERVPPSAADVGSLTRLNDEIRQLIAGEGITQPPEGGPSGEMERAGIEIDLAQQILRNPDSTPEMQQMAIEALVQRTVADYRAKRSAEREAKGQGPQLTPEALAGCCGVGRDLTAESLISLLGKSPHPVMIERMQLRDFGRNNELHAFTIVTLPDGSKMLVDPTFAQFGTDSSGAITGGTMLGSTTSRNLLEAGMTPFTPATAREYVIALGADPADADSAAAALLEGDGSILTEIVQDGEVHRTVDNPDEVGRTSFSVHGELTSHEEVRDLLKLLPPSDPRRPVLESLAARLEHLATYLPPLPEMPDVVQNPDEIHLDESPPTPVPDPEKPEPAG